jgi:simple sugar transport system ATP-binding protein
MIQRDLDGLSAGASAMLGGVAASAAAADADAAAVRPAASETPRPVTDEALQIDGLTVRDAEDVARLSSFTLIVNRGEIVGVAGVEGNGQSELAAVLSGMMPASGGRFFVRGQEMTHASPKALTAAGVGVVPEDRHSVGCISAMSLAENLMLNRLQRFRRFGLIDRSALRAAAQQLMQRFDVRAANADIAFAGLSGGNQQKAVLAREISTEGLVFLLAAQPTRGLDVGAVEAVYGQIRAACTSGAGVLLISSELDELLSVADRIVVLYRGRVMGHCAASPAARERIGAMMAGQQA